MASQYTWIVISLLVLIATPLMIGFVAGYFDETLVTDSFSYDTYINDTLFYLENNFSVSSPPINTSPSFTLNSTSSNSAVNSTLCEQYSVCDSTGSTSFVAGGIDSVFDAFFSGVIGVIDTVISTSLRGFLTVIDFLLGWFLAPIIESAVNFSNSVNALEGLGINSTFVYGFITIFLAIPVLTVVKLVRGA